MLKDKYHFAGIAGSGMLPLALLYSFSGKNVSGSDRTFDKNPDDERKVVLEKNRVKVIPESEKIDDAVLVVSSAIEKSHPQLAASSETKHRSIALKELLETRKDNADVRTVMVGGSSGKTTTTAMIAWILEKNGIDPFVYVGGEVPELSLHGARYGNGPAIIEVDESDGSIAVFSPYIAVVTSVSEDHKPLAEIENLFVDFLSKAEYRLASENLQYLKSRIYNLEIVKKSDVSISPLLGDFNRINESLAISASAKLGISNKDALISLKDFPGAARRLQILYRDDKRIVIDDFAHNPEKIAASLSAVKKIGRRIMIIFQPHGYGPTKMHCKSFGRIFSEYLTTDDQLLLLPVYDAGGTADRSASSMDIIKNVSNVPVDLLKDKEDGYERAVEFLKTSGIVVVMGARDNGLKMLARRITKIIKEKS